MADTAIREQDMPEIVVEEYRHFRRCGVNHQNTLRYLGDAYGLGTKQIERYRLRGLALVVAERTTMNPRTVADLQQAARGEWNSMRKARREDLVDLGLVQVDGDVPSLTDEGKQVLKETND